MPESSSQGAGRAPQDNPIAPSAPYDWAGGPTVDKNKLPDSIPGKTAIESSLERTQRIRDYMTKQVLEDDSYMDAESKEAKVAREVMEEQERKVAEFAKKFAEEEEERSKEEPWICCQCRRCHLVDEKYCDNDDGHIVAKVHYRCGRCP